MRHVWLACCLLIGFADFTSIVSAQPETFGGNPDSNAFIRIPRNTDDWTRHFRIGAFVGMNISANFSMNGNFNISGNNPAQGIYDNGYVRPDQSGDTQNTSYWGYDSESQLSGTTLQMSAIGTFSAASSGKESGGAFPGFEMAYGDNLWYWKHARVGWELGFGLLPINITDRQSIPVTDIGRSVYSFDVSIDANNPYYGLPLPGAPYQAGPSGEGRPIPLTPYATNALPPLTGNITGKQSLDVMLYTLRLGPTFYWDLTEHVSLSLGAGPAVGLVSGDYKYDETLTAGSGSTSITAHNSGKIGGTEFVYGGYVNATVLCHVTDNGDIYAGVQYMPMSDATIGGGGRSGRLNLGGQVYFTVGINWPF